MAETNDLLTTLTQQLQTSMAAATINPSNPTLPNFSTLNTIKLSNTNFPIWLRQITPYLRSQRLIGYADGTLPQPLPTGDNSKAVEDWLAKDQLVLAILSSSLTEPVMSHILDCETSKQAWSRLHSLYAARSNAQVVQIRLQLAGLKKGDETVSEYFNRAQSLVHQIQAAGQPLTNDEFITYLLVGLGTDYDSMVTTLSTQPILPEPTQVLSYLMLQESRISRQTTPLLPTPPASLNNTSTQSESSPELNFTVNRGRGGGSYRGGRGDVGRGRGRDERGGRTGRGRGYLTFNGGPDTRPLCQICEKRGHSALKCWSRFDHSIQAPPPRNFQANFTNSPWFPDTAATHHYTPDVSNPRIDRIPYEGSDAISLGDGSSIPILHHGFRDPPSSSQGPR